MKKLIMVLCILLLVGCGQVSTDSIKIGILQFGDYPSLNDAAQGLRESLFHYEIVETNAHGQADNLSLQLSSLVDKKVNLVVALTTQGAQMAQNMLEDTGIPFMFLAVSDPHGSGLDGFAGVSDIAPIQQQLDLVKELTPNVKDIGMVYRLSDANGVYQEKMYRELAKENGLNLISKGVMDMQDLSLVLPHLVKEVDAMFLITDDLNVSSTAQIVNEANKVDIPVYASEDGQFTQGVLASVSISYLDLGKQAADMVEELLLDNQLNRQEGPAQELTLISKGVSEQLELEVPETLKEYLHE